MKRTDALRKIEWLLMDMLDEGYFGMTECEGREFLTLKKDPENRLLDFIEKELKMKPPCVDGDKCQKLMHKYIDPSFNMWDEEYDKLMEKILKY